MCYDADDLWPKIASPHGHGNPRYGGENQARAQRSLDELTGWAAPLGVDPRKYKHDADECVARKALTRLRSLLLADESGGHAQLVGQRRLAWIRGNTSTTRKRVCCGVRALAGEFVLV